MRWLLMLALLGTPAMAGMTDEEVDAALERTAAHLERARGWREDPVRERLAEACRTLYAAQPDETVTNPLCYEVFLAEGLPAASP